MKITHAIICNGISRGIPEGTKVPEKPTVCVIPCFAFGQQCTCDKLKNNYYNDLQALWDSSIEWEDRNKIVELFPKEAWVNLRDFKSPSSLFIDGIYPLEGVNAEKVNQQKRRGLGNGGGSNSPYMDYNGPKWSGTKDGDKFEYRTVLRLIPQPDSEQKELPGFIGAQARYWKNEVKNMMEVEFTEVSEPTQYCVKVGVDEKKEPDYSLGDLKGMRFKGVSEGEPNQEELWIEALKYLRHMLGSYSTTIHKAKGMAEYFHIQKLKP